MATNRPMSLSGHTEALLMGLSHPQNLHSAKTSSRVIADSDPGMRYAESIKFLKEYVMDSFAPPPEPPPNGSEMPSTLNPDSRRDALEKVKWPAILLMITAGITLVLEIYNVASLLLGKGPDLSSLEGIEGLEWLVSLFNGPAFMIFGLFVMGIASLIFWGALKMKSLGSYGLAVTAAILALIPCFSSFCIAFPFGVWALIVLLDAEVKAAFA